jgi:hypothetical protein
MLAQHPPGLIFGSHGREHRRGLAGLGRWPGPAAGQRAYPWRSAAIVARGTAGQRGSAGVWIGVTVIGPSNGVRTVALCADRAEVDRFAGIAREIAGNALPG